MILPTALTACLTTASPALPPLRPPAVPLVVCDPYFSVWSCSDQLMTDWPRHWTGAVHALQSMVRVDGRTYRLMGVEPRDATPAEQHSVEVLPTRTIYRFGCGPLEVTLTFLTPALPHDLEQLGRPVTYLTWQLRSTDGQAHAVQLYYDNSAELVVNTPDQAVIWSRPRVDGLTTLQIGTAAQPVLAKQGDNLRIDWGWLYVASADAVTAVVAGHEDARRGFVEHGGIPSIDSPRRPRACNDDWPVTAMRWDVGQVGDQPVQRRLILAYDDVYSVEYLGRRLVGYWRRNGWGGADLLRAAAADYAGLVDRCARFDEELTADLVQVGGPQYARLCALAHRQTIAGHKLVADADGTPYFLSKECFSNGCIATVDVTYPTAPFMLALNPALLRAMMEPVLRYAASPRWKHPFAPHDLGTYPLANGQVYGGGEKTAENQMPVEECGNLLILAGALAEAEGNADYAKAHWPVLTRWAEYLKEHGLDPANQLCTDDFSGHLAHNANLSIKAIVALGCYARLCERLGQAYAAKTYRELAEGYAKEWVKRADDSDHYRLAFDKPGTWSQKYNLVWDRLLRLGLFPAEVARKEVAWYLKVQNRYGLPLDNRSEFTKTDWVLWSATLAERPEDWQALVAPVFDFAHQSPSRVPLSDWYWTKDAKQRGFQARPVVGGLFIKLLSDAELWRKWRSRGR